MPGQRKCSGKDGKKCNKFMSNFDVDPHLECISCRGQSCTRDLTCAECETWNDAQWAKYLKRSTYQDRKDRKMSSDSGSSMSMPELSIQVTPNTYQKLSKAKSTKVPGISPIPPSPVKIPDTPRTNALRAEFSSQIETLREENQRSIQQLLEITTRLIPLPSPAKTQSSRASDPGVFKTPPAVQSVALATTDEQPGPGAPGRLDQKRKRDNPAGSPVPVPAGSSRAPGAGSNRAPGAGSQTASRDLWV